MFDVVSVISSKGNVKKKVYDIKDGLDGDIKFLFFNGHGWEWESADNYKPANSGLTFDKWAL